MTGNVTSLSRVKQERKDAADEEANAQRAMGREAVIETLEVLLDQARDDQITSLTYTAADGHHVQAHGIVGYVGYATSDHIACGMLHQNELLSGLKDEFEE